MLHHYFYNSMNNKKVQFILREKDNPDFLRKYDIVKRVRYTQKGKKRICVYLNFMFLQEVYRLKKLLRIVMITILILAVDLYGNYSFHNIY